MKRTKKSTKKNHADLQQLAHDIADMVLTDLQEQMSCGVVVTNRDVSDFALFHSERVLSTLSSELAAERGIGLENRSLMKTVRKLVREGLLRHQGRLWNAKLERLEKRTALNVLAECRAWQLLGRIPTADDVTAILAAEVAAAVAGQSPDARQFIAEQGAVAVFTAAVRSRLNEAMREGAPQTGTPLRDPTLN